MLFFLLSYRVLLPVFTQDKLWECLQFCSFRAQIDCHHPADPFTSKV